MVVADVIPDVIVTMSGPLLMTDLGGVVVPTPSGIQQVFGFGGTKRQGWRARPLHQWVLLGGVVILLLVGVVGTFILSPPPAQSYQVNGGSIVLDGPHRQVLVDEASGKPVLSLTSLPQAVSATSPANVSVIPDGAGTLILDTTTGLYNFLNDGGLLVSGSNSQTSSTGIGLISKFQGSAQAYPDGNGALIVVHRKAGNFSVENAQPDQFLAGSKGAPSVYVQGTPEQVPAAVAQGSLWIPVQQGDGQNGIVVN